MYEIAIVGNDMLLAALPGRPVQLAHAILAAGYDLVVPVSWGEEVLAEHVMRVLEQPGQEPLVLCACPRVRRRLLAPGTELVPNLLSTVPPPVAAARYLRALEPEAAIRITYLGDCEGGSDPSIDHHVRPAEFLRTLEERGLVIMRQPSVFDAIVPPDRRRHWSMPGGAPSPEALHDRGSDVQFLLVDGRDFASEIAELVMARTRALIDIAPAVGCACAGAVDVHHVRASREAVVALEPPRSPFPVVDADPRVVLNLPIPHITASRGGASSTTLPSDGMSPDSVTPIHRPSRIRTERKPIAVTPPGIGAIPARSDRRPDLPRPVASPGDLAAGPVEAPAPHAPPVDLPPVPRATSHEAGAPAVAEPVQPIAGALEAAARRRTPTHEMRHVARAAAASKLTDPGEAPRVPRAYSAVRPRMRGDAVVLREVERADVVDAPADNGLAVPSHAMPESEPPVSTPVADAVQQVRGLIKEPVAGEVVPLEVASPIATVLEPGRPTDSRSDLHQAAQRALRARLRPLPPPEPANPRQLWGLLASVVLIAAVAVLLFVIFS